MNNEIKEILDNVRKCCDITKDQSFVVYQRQDILKLLDCITNLQEQLHQASLDIQELTERDIECPSWCDKLTNLQQKEELLRQEINDVRKAFKWLQQENERLNHQLELQQELTERNRLRKHCYKSRIEKAVEYIENTDDFDIEIFNESTGGCLGTDLSKGAKHLLNILNGKGSDE